MTTVKKRYGIFEGRPFDVIMLILHKYTYSDLANMARTNSSWSELILPMVKSDKYLEGWLQEQDEEDCVGMGELIQATQGVNRQGVRLLKKYIERGFEKLENAENVGLTISGFLSSEQNESDELTEVVCRIFDIEWNLKKEFFDTEIGSAVLVWRGLQDGWIYDDYEEYMDLSISFMKSAVKLNQVLNALFMFDASDEVRGIILAELYKNVSEKIKVVEEMSRFFMILLTSPGKEGDLDFESFERIKIRSCGETEKLAPVSQLFRSVMTTVLTGEQASFTSQTFLHCLFEQFGWSSSTISALLSLDPTLISLFLFYQYSWISRFDTVCDILLNTLVGLNCHCLPQWVKDHKYKEFETALLFVKENRGLFPNGAENLKCLYNAICQKLKWYKQSMRARGFTFDPFDNKFLQCFHEILVESNQNDE